MASRSMRLHECTESVNDPGLNAWSDSDGDENADKCSWTLLANVKLTNGKLFPAQPTWSNAKRKQYGNGFLHTLRPTLSSIPFLQPVA